MSVEAIPQVLGALPRDWLGTTFKNHCLLGRERFGENLQRLLSEKAGSPLTTADLEALGNAEDYLRVSSNVSTVLEYFLGSLHGLPVRQVLSFASLKMPVIATLLAAEHPVCLHGSPSLLSDDDIALLKHVFSAEIRCDERHPRDCPREPAGCVVLSTDASHAPHVDAWAEDWVLYIRDTAKVDPAAVLTLRKRMATPLTTPVCLDVLRKLGSVPAPSESEAPSKAELQELHASLCDLSGSPLQAGKEPAIFTAGLPTIAALYAAFIRCAGGVDLVMCSTAYGGSSQLTDIFEAKAAGFRKHTFHIQGRPDVSACIEETLAAMAAAWARGETAAFASGPAATVVFFEIPTNPDMKIPCLAQLTKSVRAYQKATGKQVYLVGDVTFAPGSALLEKIRAHDDEIPALTFTSLSKSVSRGMTCAGCIVSNHTALAGEVLAAVRGVARTFDTCGKPDQLRRLVDNHKNVVGRCKAAYDTAVFLGGVLQAAVKRSTARDMPLEFVTPEEASAGYYTSTFSFNLPPPAGATAEQSAGLAQAFVTLLTAHAECFKPCVSFGQDNGLIYATVPATSTQGAIVKEDKAKQQVDGVPLTRLSFPPTCDRETVRGIVEDAVARIYEQKKL
ncbi:hypothetical protein DIPPA_14401 [Diplonema papillatum]|nr:hypothetical protein DIPPA_14401 [Diplonema papillatum]